MHEVFWVKTYLQKPNPIISWERNKTLDLWSQTSRRAWRTVSIPLNSSLFDVISFYYKKTSTAETWEVYMLVGSKVSKSLRSRERVRKTSPWIHLGVIRTVGRSWLGSRENSPFPHQFSLDNYTQQNINWYFSSVCGELDHGSSEAQYASTQERV